MRPVLHRLVPILGRNQAFCITPGGNLDLAYLCGPQIHQNKYTSTSMDRLLKLVSPFPRTGSKSGVLEQPAVEKLLDLNLTSILNSTPPNIPFFNFPESRMKHFPNWDS